MGAMLPGHLVGGLRIASPKNLTVLLQTLHGSCMVPFMAERMRVTAAIIERDGKILIGKRHMGSYYGGFWEFPGGKVEEGETLESCLERELKEELAIGCTVGDQITDTRYDYPDRHIHLYAFSACITQGEPVPLAHDEIRWVAPGDLISFAFVPADLPVISAVLRGWN